MGQAVKGTLLKIGNGAATEVFTTIFQVRDISAAAQASLDTEETTHQTSTVEEVVPTIVRLPETTFQVNWNPRHATHGATAAGSLRSDLVNRRNRNFRLVTPAATSRTVADELAFSGFVTAISPTYTLAGAEFADITIKPHTTLPTYTTKSTLS